MSYAGNPLTSMDGAAGDLGLSSAAKKSAQEIADAAKKKKLLDAASVKAAGVGGQPSAFQALSGFGSV
jgi:hypothetical protein